MATDALPPPDAPGKTEQLDPAHEASELGIPGRDVSNYKTFGKSLYTEVKQARVLMVGAGGIGCELLKTLVLSGFGEVHIVDLDTIDLSNLNRQFLFRNEHIKKPKAIVAREVAQRFNPHVRLEAHHANIKDDQFDVRFFRQFRVVFNALDNLDARRHVNRMCLAANVPLVESGTTGFNGQVQVIRRGVTACYDCTPKEAPRSFPVCTIRSTPSQPIHCIVWAKSYLLNEMFGDSEDESAFDHSDDAQNADEIAELHKEAEALKALRQAVGTPDFARHLCQKVFANDISRLLAMEDMWKTRSPPTPLVYDTVLEQAQAQGLSSGSDALVALLHDGQRVWSLPESLAVLLDSIERLGRRVAEAQAAGEATLIEFDKDDIDTLDFVTASANIRSELFGIERKSRFDIKQMAGNIIPAIATTNAIVASLCVLQSFKILQGEYDHVREVFLTPFADNHFLAADEPRRPNADCPVCSAFHVHLRANLSVAVLNDIVEDFIKEKLGFGDREFVVNNEHGILYDVEETDNLFTKLEKLNIRNGTFLTVIDDEDEDPYVNIVLSIEASSELPDYKPIEVVDLDEKFVIPRRPKKAPPPPPPETNGKHVLDLETDGIAIEDEPAAAKRRREEDTDDVLVASSGGEPAAKKKKVEKAPAKDIADGGAIVID